MASTNLKKHMFYVLSETYLNPTTPLRAYGSVTHSIQEHAEEPRSMNYNNVDLNFSVGFDTAEEAEEALQEIAGDDYGVEQMSPIATENWLYEAATAAVSADTTDRQIEGLLIDWDQEVRNSEDPRTIDFEVARNLCENAREDALQKAPENEE